MLAFLKQMLSGLYLLSLFQFLPDILMKREKCHSFVSETGSVRETGWERVSVLAFRETHGTKVSMVVMLGVGVRYLPCKNIWQYLEIFFIVRTVGEHDTDI